MRRPAGKLFRQFSQVYSVSLLEMPFAQTMLFPMMVGTEADQPSIRRLERHPAIRSTSDMGAFDR